MVLIFRAFFDVVFGLELKESAVTLQMQMIN